MLPEKRPKSFGAITKSNRERGKATVISHNNLVDYALTITQVWIAKKDNTRKNQESIEIPF